MVRWCDVVWHNGISLRAAWPLCIARRPWVITHINFSSREEGGGLVGSMAQDESWLALVLTLLSPVRCCLGCLRAPVSLATHSTTLYSGSHCDGARTRELVFLGRLIPEKGLDLLLEALVLLGQKGIYPALTVIGAGPDEQRCRKITADLQHQEQDILRWRKARR